jgi:hypothetical protein
MRIAKPSKEGRSMGRAGNRQVADADVVLVHTYGGMMAEQCTLILGRRP